MTMPTVAVTELNEDKPFVLEPPEAVAPVPSTKLAGVISLPVEIKQKADAQLSGFIDALTVGNPHSDEFQAKLDAAFSIGRKEIAEATTLSNRFTKMNSVGAEDSPAYKTISAMRELFDDLNPAKQGDLFTPTKVLGIPVPFGNKLKKYLRRYQGAENQLSALQADIEAAKDEIHRDVVELQMNRQELWAAAEKLEGAKYFMTALDEKLTAVTANLRLSDPERAKAIENEVLFAARQNLGDVLAMQAVTINAYNVVGELRKTGRMVMNGCDRVSTLGMASLSIAVTLARATGNQIATQKMLSGAQTAIEDLINSTGDALNTHVDLTTQFASNPLLGIQALQGMFNKTFSAMDKLAKYRADALVTMDQNNAVLGQELKKVLTRIGHERAAENAAAPVLDL